MDNDKVEEEYPPKIYTKETLIVTPESNFDMVHEFISTASSQQAEQ